jgi:hypothetical protein
MKRIKYVLLTAIMGLFVVNMSMFAQISTEFSDITIKQVSYEDISKVTGTVVVNEEDLLKTPMSSGIVDWDDGYVKVPIGFSFEFNGEIYDNVFINVNGFITFGRMDNGRLIEPPLLMEATRTPIEAFFNDDPSYPVNVIAPFWGDHYYREKNSNFNGYLESEIAYLTREVDQNGHKVFIIQWKNININYLLDGEKIKSSVANFQLRIYQSVDLYSRQGDIEFCYGQVGGNKNSLDDRIIVKNSIVGMKGYKKAQGVEADFINALVWDNEPVDMMGEASTSKELTNQWTPSGGTDYRIRFQSYGRSKEKLWWGDGDVDFSKVEGGRHHDYYNQQNRWVTPNDVRVIMNSMATGVLLDPTIERAAYHGDVNHNGRYFYNKDGNKVDITWKNDFYDDSLQNPITKEISNPRQQIYFQVTEFDASVILAYLGARCPELPWLLDSTLKNGKLNANDNPATGLKIGDVKKLNDNKYQFPVFVNGNLSGPLGFKFHVNGTIVDMVGNEDLNVVVEHGDNIAVLSGSGEFNDEEYLCLITVTLDNSDIDITQVRFNDNPHNNISVATTVNSGNVVNGNVVVTPNPVTNNATITINTENEAIYIVTVYDMLGNKLAELYNGNLNQGTNNISWNPELETGMYFISVEGNNSTETVKVIVK